MSMNPGALKVAATGDTMITGLFRIYSEDKFISILNTLREADVAFTNVEGMIHDFKGYPKADHIGQYMGAEPFTAEELKWAGFNLVSIANNHTMDYSCEALFSTMDILRRNGIAYSGAGRNLTEAREPAYLETRNGRVALITVCSTFDPSDRAGEPRGIVAARPGINGLRFDTQYIIDHSSFEALKRINTMLKLPKPNWVRGGQLPNEEEEIIFSGNSYVLGDRPRVHTTLRESDLRANIRYIKDAKRQADWVLVSLHSHERGPEPHVPSEFAVEFAHACIDAGADAFLGHGDHRGRGIEIYKGRPIFYSLGTFVMQMEKVKRLPYDAYEKYGLDNEATPADHADARINWMAFRGFMDEWYFKSILALFTLENGKLSELKLFPVSAGYEKRRPQRGRPLLADGKLAEEIIERYRRLSSPYGTKIDFKNGVGVVELSS